MDRIVNVEFHVSGYVQQTVNLLEDISNDELEDGLKSGKYRTTLTKEGTDSIMEGKKVIGIIE